MDAFTIRRALFEPFGKSQDKLRELARPSRGLRPSPVMRPGGASMVLATFAETKVARLPGRNPATQKTTMIQESGKTTSDSFTDQRFPIEKPQDTFPTIILLL